MQCRYAKIKKTHMNIPMITISLASSDFVALILVTIVRLAYGEMNAEALVVVIANNNSFNIIIFVDDSTMTFKANYYESFQSKRKVRTRIPFVKK